MDDSNEISDEPGEPSLLLKLSQISISQTQPYIYKVHKHLRNINDKAYEPQIVAIGPYHRGKDNLKMMEDHKLLYLKSLQCENENVELYISAIRELEERARSCYYEPISLDPSQFIEMLVLDGCFIIELIRKSCIEDLSDHENDLIFQMDWIRDSLQRDLILFENQIPFFILCKLFDLIEGPDQHSTLIALIQLFCHNLYPIRGSRENWESWVNDAVAEAEAAYWDLGEIKHLLHLMHDSWRPSVQTGDDVQIEVDPVCIQSLCCLKKPSTSERKFQFNIPSATELTKANVRFSKRKSDDNSKRESDVNLFQIDFKKGVLVMPQLVFDDFTESFFRNLIAYEQYFPDERGDFVTDYVTLMDCLINTSNDVEILSKSKIIDNNLGDNEVLVGIFNKLTDSVSCSTKDLYSGIVDRVYEHYERPWNRQMAKLRRNYCNSPWAVIGVISAVLLLLLTVTQTVFSVLQVV